MAREPIDLAMARRQHADYEEQLQRLGCRVRKLPAEVGLPDSVFVEDAAVVFEELALIARPGAVARRPETDSIAAVLAPLRGLSRIEPPGTLDGGDVLQVGRKVYIGLSSRTNREAVEQARRVLEPHGYEVRAVPIESCLHLKSAATRVRDHTLLVQPDWVDLDSFAGLELIETDPREPSGANALRVGGAVVYPEAYPRTRRRLEDAGIRVVGVNLSELVKAEGAVTCCSLIFEESMLGG